MTANSQSISKETSFDIKEHFNALLKSVGLDPVDTGAQSRSWAKTRSWIAASDPVQPTQFPTWGLLNKANPVRSNWFQRSGPEKVVGYGAILDCRNC
jgi:hypothetical protein